MADADARFQNRVLIRMYDDVILHVAERANMDSAEVGTTSRKTAPRSQHLFFQTSVNQESDCF
jgi:hypothetical protein